MSEDILNKADTKSVHVIISGRVQGVGYRAWTKSTARKLDVSGWVRNCSNGTVEALFCGTPDQVEQMIARCYDGSLPSRVTDVQVTESKEKIDAGFAMRETV